MRLSSLISVVVAVAGLQCLAIVNARHVHSEPLEWIRVGAPPFLGASIPGGEELVGALEDEFGVEAEVATTVSFSSFLQGALQGRFDLMIAPPHVAAYWVDAHGYRSVARTGDTTHPVLVVSRGSGINGMVDLSGRTVSLPGRESTTTAVFDHALRSSGIRDVEFLVMPTHTHALMSLLEHRIAACVTTNAVFDLLQPSLVKNLEIVWLGVEIPLFVVVASPGVEDDDVPGLLSALDSWSEAEDQPVIGSRISFGGLVPFDEVHLEVMRPYFEAIDDGIATRP